MTFYFLLDYRQYPWSCTVYKIPLHIPSDINECEVIDMKAGFIGAGKVGFSLGKYLVEHGASVTRLLQQKLSKRQRGGRIYRDRILRGTGRNYKRQ